MGKGGESDEINIIVSDTIPRTNSSVAASKPRLNCAKYQPNTWTRYR